MRQKIRLYYAVIMYTLTTALVVSIPLRTEQALDTGQIKLLIIIGVLGYFAGSVALLAWIDGKRNNPYL